MRPVRGSQRGRGGLPDARRAAEALGLTPRQAEVLGLLLQGLPNKLIARELNLSVETVKDHVAAVLRALGVSSRTQAVLAVSQMTQGQGGYIAGAGRRARRRDGRRAAGAATPHRRPAPCRRRRRRDHIRALTSRRRPR